MKFLNYQIYTNEIPDELSLGFTILGCDVHCPECHSKHVWDINSKDIGTVLNKYLFEKICFKQKDATCILFFGGEWESESLIEFLSLARFLKFKTALYTGRTLDYMNKLNEKYNDKLYFNLDYLKIGPYIPEYGELINPCTNQRLFKIEMTPIKYDITNKFWK